jgi:hypothetical protein
MQACPLNFKRYDAVVSRVISFCMVVFLSLYVYTGWVGILLFMLYDLVMRIYVDSRLSFLYRISFYFSHIFKLPHLFRDGASKQLAGYFGIFFLTLLVILDLAQSQTSIYIISGVFGFCLLLDVMFDFCLGCKIYYIIKKIYPSFMD